jgi:hypothetical protein
MNSKKAITLLVLVTMLMALVPIVPVHAAIQITDLSDSEASYGDELTVEGNGVTSGATVNVYWDIVQETFTDGEGKIATGKAKSDGTFDIDFDVPECLNGTHYVWVKDVSTGQTDGGVISGYSVDIYPLVELSPESGLGSDTITASGYGFGYNEDDDSVIHIYADWSGLFDEITATTPTTIKTDEIGSWTATFKVPSSQTAANYTIGTIQENWIDNWANATFKVGPVITLDKTEGPSGTVVTITGRGFPKSEAISVTLGGTPCFIYSGENTKTDGKLTTKIVIPSKDLDDDDEPMEYILLVNVDGDTATANFEVNGIAVVETTPTFGPQGTQIVVEGWNFTRISGTEVEVELEGEGNKVYKTDGNGYFKGTYTLPAVPSETYTLDAFVNSTDSYHEIYADCEVRVGVMMVILTPNSATTGTEISITAIGFVENADYTVYIGDMEWFSDSAETDGSIGTSKMVPTMDAGEYTVTVVEEDSEIEVTTTLTITERTKIELSPAMAPNNYTVTVEGWYFAKNPADAALTFVLFNDTQEWGLTGEVLYKGDAVVLELDEDWDAGYFEAEFDVPVDDEISIGTYTLNVTDGEDLWAQASFDVVEKTQSIAPRKSTFVIGDTVSYNVETSFVVPDSYIKIYSPTGELYWETDVFADMVWTTVGTVNRVPYYYQTAGGNPMVLLTDAPLGAYSWKYYDNEDEVLDQGTFTVDPAPADVVAGQVTDLANQITDLSSQLEDVTDEFSDVKSDIANVAAVAQQAATAAQQAATAVQTVAQTANQANTAAQAAADAANAAKDAANGLTTLVYGAIGAALVAALAAIVSLMQISRRIAG